MNIFRGKKIFVAILGLFLLVPFLANGAEFDPNYLISDTEINDYNSMNFDDIQRFLDRRSGTLKNYITIDREGSFKTATQTFYEVSQQWMISPKYLLVLVQKEQSLLENSAPRQSQYDWATGYGCPDGRPCDERWRGFYRQVNSAAAQTRYYMDNIHLFNYQPNKTYTISNTLVTPENTATAALYNYTPHIHGNQLFWNLWNQYFGKKWPDGTLMQAAGSERVYFIENGKKREIMSKSILISRFDAKKIVSVANDDLNSYDDGVPIKYHDFSLLQNRAGEIFLIIGSQKRKIESQEIFRQIGFMEDEVIQVNDEEINSYENGPNITQHTLYPAGTLVQDKTTKEIYYLLSGRKRLVVNKEILDFNFHGLPIKQVDSFELDRYRSANPVTLPDGELVKIRTSNTVYVISNGRRLPIFNANIFLRMNYQWENIITISEETLNIHPLGQTITGDW